MRHLVRGVTGIFFGGGAQSHFSRFFPGLILAFSRQKFPYWQTQKQFQGFPKSEKAPPPQKKKWSAVVLHSLVFSTLTFSFSSFSFPFFLSSTFSVCSIFLPFSLPHSSQLVGKNFPLENFGGLCVPPCLPLPACYATAFGKKQGKWLSDRQSNNF